MPIWLIIAIITVIYIFIAVMYSALFAYDDDAILLAFLWGPILLAAIMALPFILIYVFINYLLTKKGKNNEYD